MHSQGICCRHYDIYDYHKVKTITQFFLHIMIWNKRNEENCSNENIVDINRNVY